MDKTELKNAVGYLKGNYSPSAIDDCYLQIKRKDGVLLLHYYVRSRYKNAGLNGVLPSPDVIMEIVIIINGLFSVFACTNVFARRLKKQLKPLLTATQKIKEQDLDFEVTHSKIKEFDRILVSISDMKNELRSSLEKQWRMAQEKRTQTSALAHDIKTPLTIIRGNAELLYDSPLGEKQQEYAQFILKNSHRMEQYLEMLINLTKAEEGYSADFEKAKTVPFINDIKEQTAGLAAAKKLRLSFEQKNLPPEFYADAVLLRRALMNVISNAVDYSPEGGALFLTAAADSGSICFSVADSGEGFSTEDLKRASEQFYTGDKSRGEKAHFGIGLYITKTIVDLHKGTLKISNSKDAGGLVEITIPVGL